ncbi:solute carrier family 22 member 21-like [Syngnathus acus]|uniref:solute carrier family 22 member 21-like n=1 Tax=Syngnathus acus TaxID=161584 RepID=UPI0018863DF4|nr:solute carrier family 22 member 21-like [Syngnathus acus]
MSCEDYQHLDRVVAILGEYGRYQILIMVLLSLTVIPCGYMGVMPIFIADTPAYQCRNWLKSMPCDGNSSSCYPSKVDANWSEAVEPCNGTDRCVDGWIFSNESYTIVSEWELVCENAWKVPTSTSLYFTGVLLGSLIFGQLSDRYGRKPVLFLTILLHSVTALIQAASVNWVMFCVLNCMRGLGQVACFTASCIIGSEMMGKSARLSFNLLGLCVATGIGLALLAMLAYFIRGWRMLLVATAIPSIFSLPFWWVIPESPRWLLSRGRAKEAEKVLRRAAKMNRIHPSVIMFKVDNDPPLLQHSSKDKQTFTFMDLIRTTNLRNITCLGCVTWFVSSMVFFGLALSTGNLKENIYLNNFISAATEAAAYIFTWLLISRVSRPTLIFASLMFTGMTLLVVRLVPEDMHAIIQVLVFSGRFGSSIAYGSEYLFFSELYPTVVRNTGLGVVATAGRIGTIICPYVIYIGGTNKILPFIIFGSSSVIAALLSLLLPDTRNSKLPDLINEAKPSRCCFPCMQASDSKD